MPKGKVNKLITDQEIRFAHLLLEGEMTDRQAAKKVGINPSMAAYVKAKPQVKRYMAEYRAAVKKGLVEHEVGALAEFNIGRERILAKYWEFANIDPKLTGYNTSSQSKALDSLWKALGFEAPDDPEGPDEPSEEPDIYKPQWLVESEEATRLGLDPDSTESCELAPTNPELAPSRQSLNTERQPAPVSEPPAMSAGNSAPRNPGGTARSRHGNWTPGMWN